MTDDSTPTTDTATNNGKDPAQEKREQRLGCVVLVILALLIFGGCAALVGGDDDPADTPPEPAATATPTPTPEPTPEPTATPEPAPTPEPVETPPPPPEPEPEDDIFAETSCRHFRNVMAEVDILTTDQLIEKLREVHDDAQYSDEPGIAENARQMLSTAVADDGEQWLVEVGEFSEACASAGH